VDPHPAAVAARRRIVLVEGAPHGEAEGEITHALEAEERDRVRDARHLAAQREVSAVGEAEETGGK
jgi:hypothetical protein